MNKVSHLYSTLNSAPLVRLDSELCRAKGIFLDIQRDDLIHPLISGNKWRKLKHILLDIESQGYTKVAAMGGRYSNLLHSLAYLTWRLGWQFEIYLRAYPQQPLTPMLQDALRWGAKITYLDRQTYRQLRLKSPTLAEDVYWVGEGGKAQLALRGSIEALMELPRDYDHLIIASATGTSLAGYAAGVARLKLATKLLGVAVLNNDDEIERNVADLYPDFDKVTVTHDYTFGGYAKNSELLSQFIEAFSSRHHIPLEPVYSGKSFFAVMDLIRRGYFVRGSRVLLVHCGGLQSNRPEF